MSATPPQFDQQTAATLWVELQTAVKHFRQQQSDRRANSSRLGPDRRAYAVAVSAKATVVRAQRRLFRCLGGGAALLALVVAMTSCFGSLNQTQAVSRSTQLTRQAAKAVTPDLTPIAAPGGKLSVSTCGPEHPDRVAASYELRYRAISPSRSRALFSAARRYLLDQHWSGLVISVTTPLLVVKTQTPDGFQVSYTVAIDGTSFWATTSPCVSRSS